MYTPKQFAVSDRPLILRLMREYPFALLASVGTTEDIHLSQAPLVVQEEGDNLCLWGHLARMNSQLNALDETKMVTVLFQGPHAYMSPSVYPDQQRVPSWNYLTVTLKGRIRLYTDEQNKEEILMRLVDDYEPSYKMQWQSLSESYRRSMLGGIIAFKIEVVSYHGKFKLNQHRPESFAGMYRAYTGALDDNSKELGKWMQTLGMVGVNGETLSRT